jgi:transcription antitermination factor NusG
MGDLVTVNRLALAVPKKTWYVLSTRPRAEKQVYSRLVEMGVEAFLPTYITLRQWSDRKKKVELPLFSMYVFVNINKFEYLSVLQTQGAVKYVSFNGVPAKISQMVIDNLKILINGRAEMEITKRKFRPGQKVKLAFGILKDLIGEIVYCGRSKRILVRIHGIDQNLLVKIPADNLADID